MKHLGELLVNLHLLTKQQLARSLEEQRLRENPIPLGKLLIEEGLIDEATLQEVLGIHGHLAAQYDSRTSAPSGEDESDKEADAGAITEVEPQSEVEIHFEAECSATFWEMLTTFRRLEADALYIAPGRTPKVRLHGRLRTVDCQPMGGADCKRELLGLLTRVQREDLQQLKSLDCVADLGPAGRMRVSMAQSDAGLSAMFRPLPDAAPRWQELDLPSATQALETETEGLVLISGPRGSRSKETLRALAQEINLKQKKHIVSIERFVDIELENHQSLVTQRQIGRDARTLAEAVDSACHEDADVLVIESLDSGRALWRALHLASQGVLVLAGTQCLGALQTLAWLADLVDQDRRGELLARLATTLRAIWSQDRVPAPSGHGSSRVHELLLVPQQVARLIEEDRLMQIPAVLRTGKQQGMLHLDDELERLVLNGKIPLQDAILRAYEKVRFANLSAPSCSI